MKNTKSTKKLSPLCVGNAVFIRTVTHHYTGKIVEMSPAEIVLVNAAWIADDGRFSECVSKGTAAEIEPYKNPVSINRGAVLDVTLWPGALPREVK